MVWLGKVSLAAEAQLVVVCGKVPVYFELNDVCIVEGSSEKGVGDLPVVQEFPEVFLDDVTELPLEREWSLQLIWYQERVLFRLRHIGCLHQSWAS